MKWLVRSVSMLGVRIGWNVMAPEDYDSSAIWGQRFDTHHEAFTYALTQARKEVGGGERSAVVYDVPE